MDEEAFLQKTYRKILNAASQAKLDREKAARIAALEAKSACPKADELPPAPKPLDPARWKERDYAETTRWEREQVYQRCRQREREYSQPTTQPQKPWWQRAGQWLQQNGVQPVGQAAAREKDSGIRLFAARRVRASLGMPINREGTCA